MKTLPAFGEVNNWKIILATMVIFGAGVVTGGLLVQHADRARVPRPRGQAAVRQAQPSSPGNMRLEFLRRMQKELGLTPDQQKQVDVLIKESQERTRKLMEPVSPQLREELQRTREAFRDLLTPDQRKRFDEIQKQQRLQHEPKRQPAPPPTVDSTR
jgi:Spy/CpxP family protein refolding chaperone